MNCLKKNLLFLVVSIFPTIIFAQSHFESGYIVENNNDTLKGYLKADLENNLLDHVVFSNNAAGSPQQTYSSNDIKAFYFSSEGLFEAIVFKDTANTETKYFAKALLKGYYDLYAFRKNDIEYFVVKHNEESYLLYDDVLMTNGLLDTKGNFRNQLLFLSRSCEKLSTRVTSVNYSDNEMIDFISRLNDCIAPGSNNKSVYVKPKSETHFFVYAGGLPLGNVYEFTGRAGARISTPAISRNASLNIALSYLASKRPDEVNGIKKDHILNSTSLSITLQNRFTTGIIQPYIEAGIGAAYKNEKDPFVVYAKGFQGTYGFDIIGAIGVEGYVTRKLVIKADWRYEFIVHYPVIGVMYLF